MLTWDSAAHWRESWQGGKVKLQGAQKDDAFCQLTDAGWPALNNGHEPPPALPGGWQILPDGLLPEAAGSKRAGFLGEERHGHSH